MQHINLLKALPKKLSYDVSAAVLWKILGGFFAFLMLIYAVQNVRYFVAARTLRTVTEQENIVQAKLARLTASYPQQSVDVILQEEIKSLQATRAEKQTLLTALNANPASPQTSFSQYLDGLARAAETGLWLTQIKIGNGGKDVTLTGEVIDQHLIPQFLVNLHKEVAFAGKHFYQLGLIADKKTHGTIFQIGTQTDNTISNTMTSQASKGAFER